MTPFAAGAVPDPSGRRNVAIQGILGLARVKRGHGVLSHTEINVPFLRRKGREGRQRAVDEQRPAQKYEVEEVLVAIPLLAVRWRLDGLLIGLVSHRRVESSRVGR